MVDAKKKKKKKKNIINTLRFFPSSPFISFFTLFLTRSEKKKLDGLEKYSLARYAYCPTFSEGGAD